jgi:hypothetical protein
MMGITLTEQPEMKLKIRMVVGIYVLRVVIQQA